MSFTGTVVRGDQRGRTLGFPTANIRIPGLDASAFGVYAGRVDGRAAAISIGVRPTFGDDLEPLLEAYILDFDGDLYGDQLGVEFTHHLRGMERYDTVDALVEQMGRDVERARELVRPA